MQAAAWAVLEIPSMHTAARWRPSVRLRLRAPGSEPGHSSPICYTLNSGTVKPLLERQRSPDLERLIWIGANLRNTRLRWGNFHHSAEAQSHWLLWEVGSETWWTPWKCSPKQSTRENVRRFSHGHPTRLEENEVGRGGGVWPPHGTFSCTNILRARCQSQRKTAGSPASCGNSALEGLPPRGAYSTYLLTGFLSEQNVLLPKHGGDYLLCLLCRDGRTPWHKHDSKWARS